MNKLIALILFSFISFCAFSQIQSEISKSISLKKNSYSGIQLISLIEANTKLKFVYSPDLLDLRSKIQVTESQMKVNDLLQKLSEGTAGKMVFSNDYAVYILSKGNSKTEYQTNEDKKLFSCSGFIKDLENGEPLTGVNIGSLSGKKHWISDFSGHFQINNIDNNDTLVFSYIGFLPLNIKASQLHSSKKSDIYLARNTTLDTLIVIENKKKDDYGFYDYQDHFNVYRVMGNATSLGVGDVFQELKARAGITKMTDFQSGLSVNSLSPDDNLYLLDNIRLYEPNHSCGLISDFNSNIINNVTIHTSNLPLKYNSVLSSVFDFHTMNGNFRKPEVSINLGSAEAGAYVSVPIKTFKTTLIMDYRRSLLDLYVPEFVSKNTKSELNYFAFHDINAKLTHSINPSNKLNVIYYQGNDSIAINSKNVNSPSIYKWSNRLIGFNWQYLYKANLKYDFLISRSIYKNLSFSDYQISENQYLNTYTQTQISDVSFKNDLTYYFDHGNLNFGFNLMDVKVNPTLGSIISTEKINSGTFENSTDSSIYVLSLYLQSEYKFSDKFKMDVGLQTNYLQKDVFNKIMLCPQMSAYFIPKKNYYFQLSMGRNNKFIHSLGSFAIGMPSMIWVATDDRVPVTYSDYCNLKFNRIYRKLNFTSEIYYKSLNNLLIYKELIFNYNPLNFNSSNIAIFQNSAFNEGNIIRGFGFAYGWNNMVEYKIRHFDINLFGSMNRNKETFDDINLNQKFNGKYDVLYNFGIKLTTYLKPFKILVSYYNHSGLVATIPRSAYYDPEGNLIVDFSETNNKRLNQYQSLDIGLNYERKLRNYSFIFTLGCNNCLNNFNPVYNYLIAENNKLKLIELGGIPIFPFFNIKLAYNKN